MKSISIMQPYLFPYIVYWQMIAYVDEFVIYDDVNYIKGGWVNRNNILIDGNAHIFTLSLNGASPNKKINEIEIYQDKVHKRKLINSFRYAYGKAPHFKEIFPIIEKIIENDEIQLTKFLIHQFELIFELLNITTKITLSSDIKKDLSIPAKDRLIQICKTQSAEHYINPIGGVELYRKEDFAKEGITLSFIKSEPVEYRQFSNIFTPKLSFIDVLMFNDINTVKQYLKNFELI